MSTSSVYRDGTWVTSEDEKVRASFVDLGEGFSGEYDENDPEDAALYRLDIEVAASLKDSLVGYDLTDDAEWVYPDDGSICTSVEIETSTAASVADLLRYAANEVAQAIEDGDSVKGTMDALSRLPIQRNQETLVSA